MLAVASLFVVDTTSACLQMSSRPLLTAHECHFVLLSSPSPFHRPEPASARPCFMYPSRILIHLARTTSLVVAHTDTRHIQLKQGTDYVLGETWRIKFTLRLNG